MNKSKMKKMTGISVLTAIIIVLQVICTFIKFGPYSITLALTPIIVGGAIYGLGAGTFLGAILGFVVLVTGLLGWDGGGVNALISQNAVVTVAVCFIKTAAAGFVSALTYKLLSKYNEFLAVVISGILCPVINTALFLLTMYFFFGVGSSGEGIINYFISAFVGANFLVELVTTLVLSSAITRIIKLGRKIK